jgi:outer membrane protein assembly factor BamB
LIAGCGALPTDAGDRTPTANSRTPGPFEPVEEATDWALPHHDARHSRRAPARAAPDALDERWHHPVSLGVRPPSTLAAADGRVYVARRTGERGDDEGSRLVSLDAATGRREWDRSFGPWGGQFGPTHGPLPTVVGGMVLFGHEPDSNGDRLSALSAGAGAGQWSTPVDRARTAVPAAGLLHVIRPSGRDDPEEVAALDPLTGTTVWTRSFPNRYAGLPSFDGTDLYYPLHGREAEEGATPPDRIAVLDPATGERRGHLPHDVQALAPVAGGRLFSAAWASGRIVAVDTASGDLDWEQSVQFHHPRSDDEEVVNARYNFGGVTDDRLVVHEHLHGHRSDELHGRDPATGEVRWTVAPDDDPVVQFNRPVVAGSTLYVTGTVSPHDDARTGVLRTYDATTGEPGGEVELPSPSVVPPVVAGGRLYVACQDGVRAFD